MRSTSWNVVASRPWTWATSATFATAPALRLSTGGADVVIHVVAERISRRRGSTGGDLAGGQREDRIGGEPQSVVPGVQVLGIFPSTNSPANHPAAASAFAG